MTARLYWLNGDGLPPLEEAVRADPEWAASCIRLGEEAIAERDRLRRELEALRDEMREWCHGLDTAACHRAAIYGPTIDCLDAILRGELSALEDARRARCQGAGGWSGGEDGE